MGLTTVLGSSVRPHLYTETQLTSIRKYQVLIKFDSMLRVTLWKDWNHVRRSATGPRARLT